MKKSISAILGFCFFQFAFSQFYYSDIVSVNHANTLYNLHKANKVKSVTVKNVVQSGVEENNFILKESYKKNWQEKNTEIGGSDGKQRAFTNNYNNNKVVRKDDDGVNVNSLIQYEYNTAGKLSAIKTSSVDTSAEFSDGFFEKHLFFYDSTGLPEKMLKIKNNSDTTTVLFIKDEANNVGEERWYRKGYLIETYYYYYNEKKMLTDIVRFNAKYKKMLPEFLFEYNDKGQLTQMKQIPFGSSNYTITLYEYNEQGLKTAEAIYTKRGELLNKLEYVYEY